MKTKAFLFAAALTVAGAAQAQSFGDLLNKAANLAKSAARVTSAKPVAPLKGSAGGLGLAAATPEQTAAITAAISARQADPILAREIKEAGPLIETTLKTIACATTQKSLNQLNRLHLAPKQYDDFQALTPMWLAKYHDRKTCYDVTRLTNWSKPALNALTVRAYYVSPSSGETRNHVLSFRKLDGQWLIDTIGYA